MTEAREGAGVSIRVARTFDAGREQVFRVWTDPAEIQRWWAPPGFTEPKAEMDLREGGSFRIGMRNPEGVYFYAVGEFRVIQAPERLVYSWKWEGYPMGSEDAETLVTVEFHERNGQTEVVLVHEGFPSEDAANNHEEGWTNCMARAAELADG